MVQSYPIYRDKYALHKKAVHTLAIETPLLTGTLIKCEKWLGQYHRICEQTWTIQKKERTEGDNNIVAALTTIVQNPSNKF